MANVAPQSFQFCFLLSTDKKIVQESCGPYRKVDVKFRKEARL